MRGILSRSDNHTLCRALIGVTGKPGDMDRVGVVRLFCWYGSPVHILPILRTAIDRMKELAREGIDPEIDISDCCPPVLLADLVIGASATWDIGSTIEVDYGSGRDAIFRDERLHQSHFGHVAGFQWLYVLDAAKKVVMTYGARVMTGSLPVLMLVDGPVDPLEAVLRILPADDVSLRANTLAGINQAIDGIEGLGWTINDENYRIPG